MIGGNPKDKAYRKFKSGDVAALMELLEGERAGMYDYLLRMTGQISRSVDTIDEVFQTLNDETLDGIDSYRELRICLYGTARRFNADIWNADTSRLMNSAIEGLEAEERRQMEAEDRAAAVALDRALRVLPGKEREVLLLVARTGFRLDELEEIMDTQVFEAERYHEAAVQALTAELGWEVSTTLVALRRLPSHPMPPPSTQATINLSMVMQGIKTKPVGLWSPLRLAALALLLIALGLWLWRPDFYQRLFSGSRDAEQSDDGPPLPVPPREPPPISRP